MSKPMQIELTEKERAMVIAGLRARRAMYASDVDDKKKNDGIIEKRNLIDSILGKLKS